MRFTHKDILGQLAEEFPEVGIIRIEKIVRYGLDRIKHLLILDMIVCINSGIDATVIFSQVPRLKVIREMYKKYLIRTKDRESHTKLINKRHKRMFG